ncbi:MAG: AAA family ATPase [Thermoplasmatales archaeon]
MKVILNQSVFSQDYIPSRFLGREQYVSKIVDMIRIGNSSSTFVVRGNPGVGKTLLAKYLLKELPELNGIYINCYLNSTDRSIVTYILNTITGRSYDSQNISTDLLFKVLLKELPNRSLIILDEAHSLKRAHTEAVYLLSRSKELGGPDLNLVLLTIEEPEMFLDNSTLSGIGKYNRIILKEYSREELLQIITDRANSGLYAGSYTPEALERISYLVEDSGSARTAIELLKNSSFLAEAQNSYLNEEIVLQAYRDFSPPLEDSSLANLEQEDMHILLDILNEIGDRVTFKSTEIRKILPNISDSKLYRLINSLELSGFIGKKKMSKGYKGGVENEYFFRVPPKVLLTKLEALLKE